MQISEVKTRASTTVAVAVAVVDANNDGKNDASEEVALSSLSAKTRRSKRLNSFTEEEENSHGSSEKITTNTLTLAEAAEKAALEEEISPTPSLNSNSSASTPRRKRGDTTLANLHSNLSPKYIGFTTPSSAATTDLVSASTSSDRKRSTRLRQLNTSSNESCSVTPPFVASPTANILGPCIRRTPTTTAATPTNTMTAPQRLKQSSFVSPIDKLLLKNGSTSPAAASIFEPLTPTLTSTSGVPVGTKGTKMNASPSSFAQRKTRSQILAEAATIAATIAALSSLPEPIDVEDVTPSALVEQQQQPLPNPPSEEDEVEQPQPQLQLQQDDTELAVVQHILADDLITSDKDETHLEVTDEHCTEEITAEVDGENLLFKYDDDQSTEEDDDEADAVKKEDSLEVENIATPEELLASSTIVEKEAATDVDYKTALHSELNMGAESNMEGEENVTQELAQELAKERKEISTETSTVEPPIIVIDDDDENDHEVKQQLAETTHNDAAVDDDNEAEADADVDAATNVNISADVDSAAVAAKSPSAVSMDSAQGSSVVNDAAWMSFTTGDLCWGQIYSFCYWPCMVCPDPDGKTINTITMPSADECLVHVRFFADNARRNWVKSENLMPFVGLESYEERIADVKDKYGKKSSKYKLLVPQKSKQSKWHDAVREANIVAEAGHAERLEKFYEIYEKSKIFLQNQRKRRQSMALSMLGGSMSTSDMGSLYDSTESLQQVAQQHQQHQQQQQQQIDDDPHALSVETAATKRDRSMSPFSPAYSPVKSSRTLTKRRKLSDSSNNNNNNSDEANVLVRSPTHRHQQQQPPPHYPSNQSSPSSTITMRSITSPLKQTRLSFDADFKKFFLAMKDFVMAENQDEKLESSLIVAVQNIWSLKQINQHQMQRQLELQQHDHDQSLELLGSSHVVESSSSSSSGKYSRTSEGAGPLKRLSNRLKNIVLRRSMPDAASQRRASVSESPAASAARTTPASATIAPPLPKKPQNRPIEEVVDDIFNLDSKYLFKGLGRDPVCKYCHTHDAKLVRCTKSGCQSWLHADCIGKSFESGRNGKRAVRRSKTVVFEDQIPSEELTTPTPQTQPPEQPSQQSVIAHITADEEDAAEVAAPTPEQNVVCAECAQNKPPACTVCANSGSRKNITDVGAEEVEEDLVFCSMPHCGKAYHPACCKYWPQAKITKSKNIIESFRCPSHVCHTCVSDDPKGKFQQLNSTKLTKCVRCPATYHSDSTCIPAGSQILTTAHIICPRHNNASTDLNINVSWCFICVGGGQLVCCETCPTAVHAACLNIPINPDKGYICEECESGRMPLYGEMVWAKFNTFRWWPAIILPPTEVPQNIMRKAHKPSEFVVRFFGTHDHGWISRRRVYLYLEGDSSEPPKSKSSLDMSYNRGIEEAKQVYQIIKEKKHSQRLTNESKGKLHPQPYVRMKVNRAVPPVKLHIDIEQVNKCECDADAPDPCGPDSNCLNRVLYHECNPKICPAGVRCQNQMFESRIYPQLEVVYMKERGFGLVCLEFIEAGTFVIEYVGEIINDDEFRQRMQQKSSDRDENFYFLSVEKDYIIDAGPKGNLARFMNHSCDPNCETQKWTVNGLNRVGLFAIKDIAKNTELTFNYHWDELLGSEKKTCFCGAAKCAGQIGEKYKQDKVVKSNADVQTKMKGRPASNAKKSAKPVKRLQDKTAQKKKSKKKKEPLQIKIALHKPAAAALQTTKAKKSAAGEEEEQSNSSATE